MNVEKPKIELYCKNPECFKTYLARHKIKEIPVDKEKQLKDEIKLLERKVEQCYETGNKSSWQEFESTIRQKQAELKGYQQARKETLRQISEFIMNDFKGQDYTDLEIWVDMKIELIKQLVLNIETKNENKKK